MLFSCKNEDLSKAEYLRHVGDSKLDITIDNPNFKMCFENHVYQYFNFSDGPQYIGEKPSILRTFKKHYSPKLDTTANGQIRIRFIVNCKGKAGRYRIIQSDENYEETKFDDQIINQLLSITKTIENWEIVYQDDEPIDYYYYLIFKINNGQISEILP